MEGYSYSYLWLPCNPYIFFFPWAHAWQRQGVSWKTNRSALNSISLFASGGGSRTWCALLTRLWTSNTSRHALQVCQLKTNNFFIINLCFDLCKKGLETPTHHSHSVFYSMVRADGSCYALPFTEETRLHSFSLCLSSSTRLFTAWSEVTLCSPLAN